MKVFVIASKQPIVDVERPSMSKNGLGHLYICPSTNANTLHGGSSQV